MSKDTWCIYPFVHLATFTDGALTPCCVAKQYKDLNLHNLTLEEAWNHPSIQEVRRKMIDGETVRNCSDCYQVESYGVDSHRTSSNRIFKEEYGLTKDNFSSENVDIENLITLDLRLGNTCNLKCIMCRPNESHKWYDDIIELKKSLLPLKIKNDIEHKSNYNRDDFNWIKNKLFWDNIDNILPNIKEITFGGGEPFMLKEVKKLLKYAVENDLAKNIKLRFHTNGTYLTPNDFELLNYFKKVQLMFSIDGVEDINYFLRYPADWNKIIDTINENEKYGKNIESFILASLSSVSVFYLDSLYDYVSKQKWKKLPIENIILGRVHYPSYLNPQTLNLKRKDIINSRLEKLQERFPSVSRTLSENLNWILGEKDSTSIDDSIAYINELLRIRKIDPSILKEFLEVDSNV